MGLELKKIRISEAQKQGLNTANHKRVRFSKHPVQMNIRVDSDLIEKIDRQARESGVTKSDLIRSIIESGID